MAADRNIPTCERIPRQTRRLANLLRDYNLAIKLLGQVLQPRGDVYRIAQRREHGVTAKADIADNNHSGMDTNAVGDRLDHFRSELVVQISDVGGDCGRRAQRLATCCCRIRIQPEQRQNAVADELVRQPSGAAHRLRCSLNKPVDQEHSIEWQPRLR